AAVLVEEDDARPELPRLGEQEVEDHRLARARRPDDGEIAEVADMEVEEIWTRGRRLEQCDRLAPMIARCLAAGEIVKACQACEIAGRDQAATGNVWEIARKLRPERRLQRNLFAHRD